MKSWISFVVPLLFVVHAHAHAEITVTGQLREKGTKKPLSGVNVYCFSPPENPLPVKAITDDQGRFILNVTPGTLRWKVTVANYKVLDRVDSQADGVTPPPRQFFLEKDSYLVYETTVFGQGEKRDDKTKSLTQDQFLTLPGANGDPVKAVQNLPGVNRSAFGAQVIIEGSAPSDTKYNIDTQPVPIIFHFTGLSSVVIPEAVDRVDYLSAGYGPEFGQSISGLVNLYTKEPQNDRMHAMAYVDIFNTGALVEAPINDHSSYLIGLRKSYFGQVLGAFAKSNPNFNLTVAPDFNDTILMYTNKLNSRDTFKLVTVGSIDTLAFVLPEPVDQEPSLRGDFSQNTSFYRVIPEFTRKYNADTTGRLTLGLGQDFQKQNFGTFFYHEQSTVFSGRAELEQQLKPNWKSYLGLDNNMNFSKVSFQVPYTNNQSGVRAPLSTASIRTADQNYFLDRSAAFWRNVVHDEGSRWTYLPGLRLGLYSQTKEVVPEPRMAARYAMNHGLTLRGATGLYDQGPPAQDLDNSFGNPNLKSEYAIHGTLGAEKDFRENPGAAGWTLSTDLFYKHLYNLITNSSATRDNGQPEFYNNRGTGRVYGLEALVKYQSKRWTGWLAYTLSRSTRTYPPADEKVFQYDQTHNLILIAEREFGHNWKFSGRARYTTGNPYTPLIGGTYDVDNDVYVATSGGVYSQRMEPFYQIDARFDKKWVFNSWILTGYLDVENVTNHANKEQINYSYNYSQHTAVTGLPILPTLGIKGEF